MSTLEKELNETLKLVALSNSYLIKDQSTFTARIKATKYDLLMEALSFALTPEQYKLVISEVE